MAKQKTKPVYQQWHDGEPHVMDPQREIIKLACCDCGLVHDLHLTVAHRRKATIVLYRNVSATNHERRRMKPTTIQARLTKRS